MAPRASSCWTRFAALGAALLVLDGCASRTVPTAEAPKASSESAARPGCYALFDAGSSGTRLSVFERSGSEWVAHAGPKVDALADPVRAIRGKTAADLDSTTTHVAEALDGMDQDGPLDSKGVPQWRAFDWQSRCNLKAAMVYGTGGMRLAEQENRAQSIALWESLQRKLKAKLPDGVPVVTRTLTGFEEGLFGWLAVREQKDRDDFGIVEVGGASAQVTFPCERCDVGDEAVRTIELDSKPVQFFSYSFLGLGIDEAPVAFGMPAACAYQVGHNQPGWRQEDCADSIELTGPQGISDPYGLDSTHRGTYQPVPIGRADVASWFLIGAFARYDRADIETCCVDGGECYDQPNSCFRSVYVETLLEELAVPALSPDVDTSWTTGAVVCKATDCLRTIKPPLACNWLKDGCL